MTSAPARSWAVLGRLILSLSPRAPGALEPASASPPAHLPFDPHSPLLGQILLPRALSPASLFSWLSAQWVQRLHMFMAPGQTSGCEGRGCCVAHFPRKGTRASITPMGGFPVPPPPRLPACPSLAQAAGSGSGNPARHQIMDLGRSSPARREDRPRKCCLCLQI